jgi:hypothetical protein
MIELIFKEAGKYKNDNKITVITPSDVKNRKVFMISGKNADNFVKAGKAEYANAKKSPVSSIPKVEIKKEEKKK